MVEPIRGSSPSPLTATAAEPVAPPSASSASAPLTDGVEASPLTQAPVAPATPHAPRASAPRGAGLGPDVFTLQAFEERLAAIYQRLDPPRPYELADDEAADFRTLDRTERRMLQLTLNGIDRYQANPGMTRADYMVSTLENAATLARGEDGVADPERFVELVHLAMNTLDLADNARERPLGSRLYEELREGMRGVLGAGHRPAGSAVEVAYGRAVSDRNEGPESYNPNVVEKAAPGQSLTHHYAEFLIGAFRRPDWLLEQAQAVIDDPIQSPGDYRSGMFAIMIGGGLETGEISVQRAIDLTEWAYRSDSDPPPPWGRQDLGAPSLEEMIPPTLPGNPYAPSMPRIPSGYFLTPAEYRLEDWLAAYPGAG